MRLHYAEIEGPFHLITRFMHAKINSQSYLTRDFWLKSWLKFLNFAGLLDKIIPKKTNKSKIKSNSMY